MLVLMIQISNLFPDMVRARPLLRASPSSRLRLFPLPLGGRPVGPARCARAHAVDAGGVHEHGFSVAKEFLEPGSPSNIEGSGSGPDPLQVRGDRALHIGGAQLFWSKNDSLRPFAQS